MTSKEQPTCPKGIHGRGETQRPLYYISGTDRGRQVTRHTQGADNFLLALVTKRSDAVIHSSMLATNPSTRTVTPLPSPGHECPSSASLVLSLVPHTTTTCPGWWSDANRSATCGVTAASTKTIASTRQGQRQRQGQEQEGEQGARTRKRGRTQKKQKKGEDMDKHKARTRRAPRQGQGP